ncbi:MAG: right-handed parallel beta-helix repeat-containing protein [Anaerolineae bacterium]
MGSRRRLLFAALVVALGLAVGLLGLVGGFGRQPFVRADAGDVYCVTPGGGTYAACTEVFTHVQAAVDAAIGSEEIRIAAGTYTGVRNVPVLSTDSFTATQVLVITKAVTIRGGYTPSDWTTPDPAANPTTLDAQGQGRVLVISGNTAPTVEGLRIMGGDATGLGGRLAERDAGGGVYISEAAPTISDCVVTSNTASTTRDGWAGGVYLDFSNATLSNNTVASNTASTANDGWGGGLYLWSSNATLIGNTVRGNIASTAWTGYGGGVGSRYSDATLIDNVVRGNTASASWTGFGGGLYLRLYSDATLIGNTVQGNTASGAAQGNGGGLYLRWSDSTLVGNTVVSNTATLNPRSMGHGGGLVVRQSSPVILTNNLVAGNQANTEGSGLWFEGTNEDLTSGQLLHNTIAHNGASDGNGQGVFVGEYATLSSTNTIIADHNGVGITVTAGSTATLEATLWDENGLNTGGSGAISTGAVNVLGDPKFVDPSTWDYHLRPGSAAIDRGVDAGVTTDLDGSIRPLGRPDLGAYEGGRLVYLPLVLR